MIRVNLLGVPREAVREMAAAPAGEAAAADRDALLKKLQGPIAAALFVAGAAYLGLGWVKSNGELDRLAEEIQAETERKARLAEISKKAADFEAKKKTLQGKIDVITSLKDNQATPVFLMDEVSRRLDDHVWIQGMTFKGSALEIKGSAFTITAMTNFMKKLGESPYMANLSLKQAKDQKGFYGFDVTCALKGMRPEKLAPKESASEAAAAPAGAAKGKS